MAEVYDCHPDRLTMDQYREHICSLIDFHSKSTVISNRTGLALLYRHVLYIDWAGARSLNPNASYHCPMSSAMPKWQPSSMPQLTFLMLRYYCKAHRYHSYSHWIAMLHIFPGSMGTDSVMYIGIPCPSCVDTALSTTASSN